MNFGRCSQKIGWSRSSQSGNYGHNCWLQHLNWCVGPTFQQKFWTAPRFPARNHQKHKFHLASVPKWLIQHQLKIHFRREYFLTQLTYRNEFIHFWKLRQRAFQHGITNLWTLPEKSFTAIFLFDAWGVLSILPPLYASPLPGCYPL